MTGPKKTSHAKANPPEEPLADPDDEEEDPEAIEANIQSAVDDLVRDNIKEAEDI